MLPNDPIMLMSFLNTKLRDEYSSLDELCQSLSVSKMDVTSKLEKISYIYDEVLNRFIQKWGIILSDLNKIEEESFIAASEILDIAKIQEGRLFVVGCSTSEVTGGVIGKASSPETAKAIFNGIYRAAKKHNVYLVAQCCEHLNRALILENEVAEKYGYEPVNVIPQPKAGGSFATVAYEAFDNPVAVEHIRADAGMDIGDTLIGMHLKDVAVPVRISLNKIGQAHVVCARTRAKFVGGSRAVYDENIGWLIIRIVRVTMLCYNP